MSARRKRWIAALVALVGVLLLATWKVRGRGDGAAASAAGGAGPRGGGGADRAIPVAITRAATRDVPSFLDGLGSVVAYKTVNVRTQVEGRLDRVAFVEGQPVKKGDLLAQVDPRPFAIQLHQAQAALARDQAQLRGAERNLTRFAAVSAERLIPQQQVDDQRALTEQLQGTVASDKAQIENAKLQLAYARITSPIDGVTGIRLVDQGNVVHAADASGIVVVTQLDPIAVLFTLPQDDLPRVVLAQAERDGGDGDGDSHGLSVQAVSRSGDQLIAAGRLALVDNQINQSTATIRLKAVFANPAHTLWPNQFVKARLQLGTRKGALVVPSAAVQRGPQGTFVYVAGDDDRAVVRPVDVEAIEGEIAILSRGVASGERVVSEGQNQLRPGARVSVREPEAAPAPRGKPAPHGGKPAAPP